MMMNCQTLIAWFALIAVVTAKESNSAKRIIAGVKDELRNYMTGDSHNFFEILMGERLHQTYDFRITIDAKSLQCYYQEAGDKTSITANYECLDSPSFVSSGKISATAIEISRDDETLSAVENKRQGELEIKTDRAGTYGFCFDNGANPSPATVQITFDIWRLGEIPKFHEAQQESNNTIYHAFDGMFQVTKDVAFMRASMSHTRSTLFYDYSTRMSNLSRITNFSLLSIVLIASVCFIQLRVVKKMFENPRSSV